MNIELIAFSVSAVILIISVGLLAGTFFRYVNRKLEPDPAPGDPRPLEEYRHRQSLTDLLRLNRITGDADIRDGQVFPYYAGRRGSLLAEMFNAAYRQARNDGTYDGFNLYYAMKPEGGEWMYRCFGDVGLGDIAEAARQLKQLEAENEKLIIEKAKS